MYAADVDVCNHACERLVVMSPRVAQAQTVAVGPYYATPSWDQTIPAGQRFVVLSNFNNQAILDRETGLVWQKSPVALQPVEGGSAFTYDLAWQSCNFPNGTPRFGWRIPTLPEFLSLLDATLLGPAPVSNLLPTPNPFNIPASALVSGFWTSTTVPGGPHWVTGLDGGIGYDSDDAAHGVLCVRGGSRTDNPH